MNTIDPRELTERLRRAGEEWADLNAAAEVLEETKPILLAQIASTHANAGSMAKAEMLAKADPRYADHVGLMVSARKDANKARVKYDSGKAYVELVRSAEASRRAEMKL
jgi:multidrug resistance efflux pump